MGCEDESITSAVLQGLLNYRFAHDVLLEIMNIHECGLSDEGELCARYSAGCFDKIS